MAAEIIYNRVVFVSEPPWWKVERQPEGVTDPMVVRFCKVGKNGTLLDQNARWTPLGWDSKRWVPAPSLVPKWLLKKVELHMQALGPQP